MFVCLGEKLSLLLKLHEYANYIKPVGLYATKQVKVHVLLKLEKIDTFLS